MKPIIFNSEMVRAIMDGRKTQTRRPVKPQPPETHTRHCWYSMPVYGWTDQPEPAGQWHTAKCPYEVGDVLWVRETWGVWCQFDDNEKYGILYKSDRHYSEPIYPQAAELFDWDNADKATMHWRPSIHMPLWAARLFLRVTAPSQPVRLQEISTEAAKSEGIPEYAHEFYAATDRRCADEAFTDTFRNQTTVENFRDLWDSIYASRGLAWNANPWVWIIEFERTEVTQ